MKKTLCFVLIFILMIGQASVATGMKTKCDFEVSDPKLVIPIENYVKLSPILTDSYILWIELAGESSETLEYHLFSKSLDGEGEKIKLTEKPICYLGNHWSTHLVKTYKDWVAFYDNDLSTNLDEIILLKADNSEPMKKIGSLHHREGNLKAFDIHDGKIYFWQNLRGLNKPSGIYIYNIETEKSEIFFETGNRYSHSDWLSHTGQYVAVTLVGDFRQYELLVLDQEGNEIKNLSFGMQSGFMYHIEGSFIGIISEKIFFQRSVYKTEDGKKKRLDTAWYIQDINQSWSTKIEFPDSYGWIDNSYTVEYSPFYQTFIGYFKLKDVKGNGYHFYRVDPDSKDTKPILIDDGAIIGSRTAPVMRHFSCTWKNYTVYPSDLEKDDVQIFLYDSLHDQNFLLTEMNGKHGFPVIKNNVIVYYKFIYDDVHAELIIRKIKKVQDY